MHQGTCVSFIVCFIYGFALQLGHGDHVAAHGSSSPNVKETSNLSESHNATRRDFTSRRVEELVSPWSGGVVSTRSRLAEDGAGVESVEGGADEGGLRRRPKTKNPGRLRRRRKRRRRRRRWWRNRIHKVKKNNNNGE